MTEPIVAVVGAGPAGMRAAETLARAGLRPIVFDEAEQPGGQVYRQPPAGAARPARELYGFEASKAQTLHRVLGEMGSRVDYRPRTLVWNVFQDRLDLLGSAGYGTHQFDRVILATGAMDRILPFPGWTLPGVFTLGGAQIALKSQGVSIGRRVAFVGAGPLLPLVAYQYINAGADVAAVLDVTPFSAKIAHLRGLLAQPATLGKGLWYLAKNRARNFVSAFGVRALRAEGRERVEALVYEDKSGQKHRIACDAIGVSFGLRCETQLADLAGCRFIFDPIQRQWLPERSPEGRSSVFHVYLAGDGAGIGGADVAELEGRRTALSVLEDLGHTIDPGEARRLSGRLAQQVRFRRALENAYPFPQHLLDHIDDEEIVCRCEGITAGTLREAAREKEAGELNRLKAFTRIGMGRCQGRICEHAAAELLARARSTDIEGVGRLRAQPPVKPIPVLGAVS